MNMLRKAATTAILSSVIAIFPLCVLADDKVRECLMH